MATGHAIFFLHFWPLVWLRFFWKLTKYYFMATGHDIEKKMSRRLFKKSHVKICHANKSETFKKIFHISGGGRAVLGDTGRDTMPSGTYQYYVAISYIWYAVERSKCQTFRNRVPILGDTLFITPPISLSATARTVWYFYALECLSSTANKNDTTTVEICRI